MNIIKNTQFITIQKQRKHNKKKIGFYRRSKEKVLLSFCVPKKKIVNYLTFGKSESIQIYACVDQIKSNTWKKMHLATEVTSTTNHQLSTTTTSSMDTKNSANENNNQSKSDSAKTNNNGFLTAQELAERTIDSLLAEHPGELVRTGSPHIVISKFII